MSRPIAQYAPPTVDMAGGEIAVGDTVVVQGGELDGRSGEVDMVPGALHPGGRNRVRVIVEDTESPAIWFEGRELLVIEQAIDEPATEPATDTTPALERAAEALLIAEHGEHADMYRPDIDTARAALDAALDVDELAELFELCGPADARPLFEVDVDEPAGWSDCMCGNGPGIWASLETAKRHQAYVIRVALLGGASGAASGAL